MDYLFFHGVSIIDFDQVFGHWKVLDFIFNWLRVSNDEIAVLAPPN